MKRFLASLAMSLGIVLAQAAPAAAVARFWEVQIFDPAASTVNKTLNVEYKVFSTFESEGQKDDDFDVKLLQNGSQVGSTQHVSTPGGDSGVFNVSMPANGSYTFKVVATNNDAGETKESAEKTVQVVDGPTPVVRTVSTSSSTGGGAGAGSTSTAGAGGAAGTGAVSGAQTGQVGQVDSGAAQTENGDVLGAETKEEKSSDNNWWYVGGGLALLLAGVGYYWFVMRPKTQG